MGYIHMNIPSYVSSEVTSILSVSLSILYRVSRILPSHTRSQHPSQLRSEQRQQQLH